MPPRKASEWQKTQMKLYNAGHRDEIKAKKAAYYLEHKEETKARTRKYYALNRAMIIARASWQSPERRNYNKRWRATHPRTYGERDALYCERRYARKRNLPDTLTIEEWRAIKAAYENRCAYCGKQTKLAQDHVLPLSKGGGTVAQNIVPSCKSCNSRKNANPPPVPIKVLLF